MNLLKTKLQTRFISKSSTSGDVSKLISDTVIKFHLCTRLVLSHFHFKWNIYSITSKLTIDLTLNYVKIFKFQNGSTKKLFYKQSLSLNVWPRVLKSPQSHVFNED